LSALEVNQWFSPGTSVSSTKEADLSTITKYSLIPITIMYAGADPGGGAPGTPLKLEKI